MDPSFMPSRKSFERAGMKLLLSLDIRKLGWEIIYIFSLNIVEEHSKSF